MMQGLYVQLNPRFRCKSEIKKGENSLHLQIGLTFKDKLVRCYIWNIAFILFRNFDSSGCRSEIAGMFQNVVLDKDGQDQLD
jgi:hypothetical protein